MSRQRTFVVGGVVVAVLALSAALVKTGVYGYTLFLLLPIVLGMVAAMITKPKTAATALALGAAGPVAASLVLFGLGWEGAICIAMFLPIGIPLGALGGLLFYYASRQIPARRTSAMLLFLPLGTLGFDVTAQPPVFTVTTTVDIAATPERIWPHVVSYANLEQPDDWVFHTGVGYPIHVRMVGSGTTGTRYCDFSTGSFVEPIEVWDAPRLLRFRVTESAVPMHEWSFYSHVEPKHLHGYFVSKEGEFRLVDLGNGRTRVIGTSWYQHGLWPAQYWRLWSDAIIHRIHARVLGHIKELAEAR